MDKSFSQLSKIEIEGFKSIKKCDIKLKKINILIGSNGSGKSNFISLFMMLQNILYGSLAYYVGQVGGANMLLYNGRKFTEDIVVKMFFDNKMYGFALSPTDDNRLIFKREYFGDIVDEEYLENKSYASTGSNEIAWGLLRRGKSFKFAFLRDSDGNLVAPAFLVGTNWITYHFNDTSKDARIKQEHNLSNNIRFASDARNLAAFLYRLKKHYQSNYKEIVSTIKLIATYFEDFELEPSEGNNEQIILKWKQKGCEDIFNASQLSDGTLRFICLAVLLLQPIELQPATIIIDEPELGLHPLAISILAELVRQVSVYKQIIISTQSVELLNEFDAEDVIVVDRNNDGSVFKRLDEESLKIWLEDDYTLGELWNKNIFGGRLSK